MLMWCDLHVLADPRATDAEAGSTSSGARDGKAGER